MGSFTGYGDFQFPSDDYDGLRTGDALALEPDGSPVHGQLAFAPDGAGGGGSGGAGGGITGGGGTITQPPPPSPYPAPANPGLVAAGKNSKLHKALHLLAKKKPYLKLALADLTGIKSSDAPYVGFKDHDLTFVGSTDKISLILPAFHLRQAARGAAASIIPPPVPADFLAMLEKAWSKDFTRGFLGGGAKDTKPKLRAILSATRVSGKKTLKIDLTTHQHKVLSKAGFRPRLILAEQLSVNAAAALCIRDLGFPFIHEAHRAAGLEKDGLSLGLDYGGKAWGGSMPRNEHAKARWLTELLMLIARDRLVAPGLAPDIYDVMATDQEDLAIGINNYLSADESLTLTQQGKVGYIEKKGPFADCGIIRRTTAKGTNLVYVAVALNGKSHADIREVGAALDDCILAAHGEPLKQTSR